MNLDSSDAQQGELITDDARVFPCPFCGNPSGTDCDPREPRGVRKALYGATQEIKSKYIAFSEHGTGNAEWEGS